jgi:tetratricopeptide (TPR) repeat protein
MLLGPLIRAEEVADQLAAARAAREAKDFPRAAQILTDVLAAHPASSEALIARGYVWLAQKKSDQAAADFNQAVAVDPTNPQAYLIRGDLAHRLIAGDFAACEADYATVLRLDPKYPHFRAYSAELYLYLKQPGRVIVEALQGLLQEPTEAIHKINLAHGLAFVGQIDAAKVLYAEVAATNIERGLNGAKLALGDYAQLQRRGIDYPQIAELKPFLEKLAAP